MCDENNLFVKKKKKKKNNKRNNFFQSFFIGYHSVYNNNRDTKLSLTFDKSEFIGNDKARNKTEAIFPVTMLYINIVPTLNFKNVGFTFDVVHLYITSLKNDSIHVKCFILSSLVG